MNMKSICLVGLDHVLPDRGASICAIDLAERHKAHLTIALGAGMVFAPTMYPSAILSTLEAEVNKRHQDEMAIVARSIAHAADIAGVVNQTRIMVDPLLAIYESLTAITRVNDLTVVNAPAADDGAHRDFVEEMVRSAGGPVLIVPPDRTKGTRLDRIMVAWNGGLEAARALHLAMPLLEQATAIEIVTVAETKTGARKSVAGVDVATYLSRICRNVTETDLPDIGSGAAATIQNHASLSRTDLVVMGFYGHTRLREWVFGGATRSMLRNAVLPILMSS